MSMQYGFSDDRGIMLFSAAEELPHGRLRPPGVLFRPFRLRGNRLRRGAMSFRVWCLCPKIQFQAIFQLLLLFCVTVFTKTKSAIGYTTETDFGL
jgi:DTW domain-containing protein YfiP